MEHVNWKRTDSFYELAQVQVQNPLSTKVFFLSLLQFHLAAKPDVNNESILWTLVYSPYGEYNIIFLIRLCSYRPH